MAPLRIILIMFITVSLQLMSQNIRIDDFKIPESGYKNIFGSVQGGFGNYNHGSASQENTSASNSMNFSLSSLNGSDNEQESYRFQSSLSGSYGKNSNSYIDHFPVPFVRKESNSGESTNLNLNGRYAFYLTPDEWYLYGSSTVSGYYGFSRNETDTNNVPAETNFYKSRSVSGNISGGFGYGKMRDGSAVFLVVRILEKLNEDNCFARELSTEEILALVEIVAKRIEYDVSYDRPKKYLLNDILTALGTMNVLKENKASAYEVARIDEVFQEYIFPRMVGWTVDAGIGVSRYQSEYLHDQYIYLNREFYRSDLNNAVVNFRYGKAFSLSLHWYSTVSITIPVIGKQNRVDKRMNSALSYQLGEKVNNELSVRYDKTNQYGYGSVTTESYNFFNSFSIVNSTRYFIENNIYFSFSVDYFDDMNIVERNSSSNRTTSSGMGVSFGLNYRFY